MYRCMEPLPALECDRVACPVGIGMGGQEEGLHGRLARSGAALQAEMRRGQLYRLVYMINWLPVSETQAEPVQVQTYKAFNPGLQVPRARPFGSIRETAGGGGFRELVLLRVLGAAQE